MSRDYIVTLGGRREPLRNALFQRGNCLKPDFKKKKKKKDLMFIGAILQSKLIMFRLLLTVKIHCYLQ